MLRIRLSRVGKKKQPAYRIVVADSRSPRDGAFLKIIGHYNPLTDPATLVVKEDEAVHWLGKGAKPSETAAKLLTRIGVMERAGRAPVRYEGKDVPAKKKEDKASPPTATAEPKAKAKAEAKAEAEAPEAAAEAEAPETAVEAETPTAEAEAPETAVEAETPEPAPEAEAEVTEEEPEAAAEAAAEETETETEPEATSEEQDQEQAENQE